MDIKESSKTLEEEIAELERELAKKKEVSPETPKMEEKELFRDVLREHIERAEKSITENPVPSAPVQIPSAPAHDYTSQAQATARKLREEEHHDQVEALVEIALTKGVLEAVNVARHLGNPHLLDDFHDALVDDYYEKLVESRIISSS